ncbi:YvrJ family protein [Paenibacillus terreus]|uniref:YvrJ family protein n=1 Tax=Paenibacillus terreus TaxID=1387834 RepID=A0ABV5B4A5_9BACL
MHFMDLQAAVQLIGNVGFPIAISLILLQTILVKFNKQMEGLEKRLAQLDKTMNLLVRTIPQTPPKTMDLQDKKID